MHIFCTILFSPISFLLCGYDDVDDDVGIVVVADWGGNGENDDDDADDVDDDVGTVVVVDWGGNGENDNDDADDDGGLVVVVD